MRRKIRHAGVTPKLSGYLSGSQFALGCNPMSSHFCFRESEKMSCVKHKRYVAGCKDCQEADKLYRKQKKSKSVKINEKTHYKNGIKKPQGIYSESNWEKFNTLGRKLTKDGLS